MKIGSIINIILALDEKNGIGKNGILAWKIKEDMKYFRETTIGNFKKQNAVIMGRKTWDSIPEKYKPLPNRINCILSRKFKSENNIGEIRKFSNFNSSIKKLNLDENIGEIFIIGGSQIYNEALKHKNLGKVYLTRIKGNFDCDIFVDFNEENFELIENSEWKKNKKGIEFRFEVYKNKKL